MIIKGLIFAVVLGLGFWFFNTKLVKLLKMCGIEVVDDRPTAQTDRQKEVEAKRAGLASMDAELNATQELIEVSEEFKEKDEALDKAEEKLKAYI